MYEQAEPVRSPFTGLGKGQTSGPPSWSPPAHQSGARAGRVVNVNGSSDKGREDQETSTDTYEEAEVVKAYTSADRTYPGGASDRRAFFRFLGAHRSCLVATFAVVLSLVAVGLAALAITNKEDISQLTVTADALKRNLDDLKRRLDNLSQLTTTVEDVERRLGNMSLLTTTYDDLKRRLDNISELTTTPDDLERRLDNLSQLNTTFDDLERHLDNISELTTTPDSLERHLDDERNGNAALKQSLNQMKDAHESPASWSASSEFDCRHSPSRAELNSRETADAAGAWSARMNNRHQWLMRDLGDVKIVTGIITKGRDYSTDWPHGHHEQFVTSYSISYGNENGDEKFYIDADAAIVVFPGNSDRDTEIGHDFKDFNGTITARFIKIHPLTWHEWTSMRAKIITASKHVNGRA